MHQVQKGKQYYFGMKLHNGVDAQSGMVHSMVTTPANVHDVAQAGKLLHGKKRRVWGDAGYLGVGKRKEEPGIGRGVVGSDATREGEALERGSLADLAEKRKARYRGLAKKHERLAALLGGTRTTVLVQYTISRFATLASIVPTFVPTSSDCQDTSG